MNIDFINSLVRAGMQALAGILVAKGIADASVTEPLIGVGLSIAGLVWSYFTHQKPV